MKLKGFKKILAIVLMLTMAIQLLPAVTVNTAQAATTYVRIKNVWQNQYLYQNGDKVSYGNVGSDNTYSHWEIMDVGDGSVRVRNRATGDYMHIENLKGYIQCGSINNDWHSARWNKLSADNGFFRFQNKWQPGQYWHIENLKGYTQSGSINDGWSSAKWAVETVASSGNTSSGNTSSGNTQTPVQMVTFTVHDDTTTDAYHSSRYWLGMDGVDVALFADGTEYALTRNGNDWTASIPASSSTIRVNRYQNSSRQTLWDWWEATNRGNRTEMTLEDRVQNWHWGAPVAEPVTEAPTQAPVQMVTFTVHDDTTTDAYHSSRYWLGMDGVDVALFADGTEYALTRNGNDWIASIPASSSTIRVNRYQNSSRQTLWDWWEATNRGNRTEMTLEDRVQNWHWGAPIAEPVTEAPTEAPTQAPVQTPSSNVANNTSGVTLYFYGNGWSNAYLWSWNGYSTNTWPGNQFTKVSGSNNWWKLDVNASGFVGYIQESGGGRGCDKTFSQISGNGTYFVVYKNDSETLYRSQAEAEAAAGESISGGAVSNNNNTNNNTTNNTNNNASSNTGSSTGATTGSRVVGYNVPAGKTTSSNVSMKANNVSVGVFDTTVNNTHTWVGYYPALSSSRVAIFDFENSAAVDITVNYNVNSATIRPLADGVTPTITHNGNTTKISFVVSHPGQYSVELNNNHTDAIMVFASAIESAPTGNVITVPSGQARYDEITVGNGQTLYIEGGAAVYGRVFCQSGSTVAGRGIIDQSHWDTWGGSNGRYPMSIEFANNVHVNGVAVLNSSCWNYQIYNSSDVYLDNIKIISARPNGDGISIQSSSNVHVTNSFVRTWDDGVVLKNYSSNNTHDVYCDNVVFWTDLAQSMEIGVETNAGYAGTPANPAIYNVEFTNIDVIHERHKAPISIHNGDNANIYNIKWENVNIEDFTPEGDGWNYWLDFTTAYPSDWGGYAGWAHHWDGTGTIHDITLKNINVTSGSNPQHRIWDYWASQNRGYSIYNVTCTNCKVNGSNFKY